jgi:hypothetical protein
MEIPNMRGFTLSVGLLLILASFYVINAGPQVLAPVAELAGLVTHSVSVTPVIPSTLLTVPASNYSYLTADLKDTIKTTGTLQVEGGSGIGFYVMNAGNFSDWRQGYPSAIVLSKLNAIEYNFTFTPPTAGTYYFVFSNQDPVHKNVVFTLSTMEDIMLPHPLVQYAGYEMLLIGVLLSIFAVRTGKRKPKPPSESRVETESRCKFCGERIVSGEAFCPRCGKSQA